MSSANQPPYYILFSHTSLSSNATSTIQSTSLGHPIIQYHYADDSPLALLPQNPDEHVLILDYDPLAPSLPAVKSTSQSMTVTGLKIAEAPGSAAEEGRPQRNNQMYVIETTTRDDRHTDASQIDRIPPQVALAHFKQRNAVLRRAMVPDIGGPKEQSPLASLS